MAFFQKTKGAISIFLVLIMVPMFVFGGLVVDGARISAARMAVSGAGDLAMNAALSEYEVVLKDVYGLFAMSETTEELELNVSRYFSNTINNAGILESSDSYTRSFINSIGSLFATEEISFDNIIDLEVEPNGFNLVTVSNSSLANPAVMERQIIEYMKYRGPINIGTGLLTKLGCLGETSKQTKALEKKVDYEKKLDSVQDACETAYSAINAFNSAVEGSEFVGDYRANLNAQLGKTRDLYQQMVKYIIAAKATNLSVDIPTIDGAIEEAVEEEIKDMTTVAAYEHLKEKLSSHVVVETDENGDCTIMSTDFISVLADCCADSGDTLEFEVEFTKKVKESEAIFTEVYTYLYMLENEYNAMTDAQKGLVEKEFAEYSEVATQIFSCLWGAYEAPGTWKNTANAKGREATEDLYSKWYSELGDFITKLQDAIDALNAVKDKVDELKDVKDKWRESLDNLSDSDIKSSMEGDYEKTAMSINEDVVTALITVLENNKTHFEQVKTKLDSVKFDGQKVCIENSGSVNFANRFSHISESEITSGSEVSSKALNLMNSYYVNADVMTGLTPALYEKITEAHQFYKYLKDICTSASGTATDKTNAENNRKKLVEDGKSSEGTTADVAGITTGSYVTAAGLTAEISAAIDEVANGSGLGTKEFNPTAMDANGGSDDQMADAGKSNLSGVSALLEGLTNVATTARDKAYLEEYFTEMFSCYTSGLGGKDASGNLISVPALALNQKDMSTNKFFRSEVEYILWGSDNVETNLNNTKAAIFGIRFALNSIYALTSSDTRTPALSAATAIAGWTGFGVPLVQTVILLAWSLAESVVDVNNLCAGEDVCIYKSKDTWVLGIEGATKEIKKIASAAVDDIFGQISDLAEDTIGNAKGYVEQYVQKTQDGIVDSVTGAIMTTFESLVIQVIGETNYNLQKDDIGDKVDAALTSLEQSVQGEELTQKAAQAAIAFIKNNSIQDETGNSVVVRQYLIDKLYDTYTKTKEGTVSAVSAEVEDCLEKLAKAITTPINNAISSCGDALVNEVQEIIANGGDLVKEKIIEKIDEYTANMSGGGGGTAVASGLTLNYKEYLKAFVLLNIIGNEDVMLTRCAKLIQANVSQQSPGFDISKAYTMIEMNGKVSVRTTFFSVPVSAGVDAAGNTVYSLDFGNIGTGRQSIQYIGILGY